MSYPKDMIRQKLGEREVMDYQQLITFMMEMVGTVAFAASGAMVAVDRAMDIFGVIVLGVTTAVGGGALRDVILGIVPPGHVPASGLYDRGNDHILYCFYDPVS